MEQRQVHDNREESVGQKLGRELTISHLPQNNTMSSEFKMLNLISKKTKIGDISEGDCQSTDDIHNLCQYVSPPDAKGPIQA